MRKPNELLCKVQLIRKQVALDLAIAARRRNGILKDLDSAVKALENEVRDRG